MTGIEKACFLIWKLMQLSLLFHLLCLCGLIVFGIGPAWQTIVALFLETVQEEKHYSLKRAFTLWKSVIKHANVRFWLFVFVMIGLGFNLHLATQFQSLFWFMISFIILMAMIWVIMIYIYMTFYGVSYDIRLWDNIKLAFISVFLSFKQFLMMLTVIVGVGFITWQYKGLFIFMTFGLLVFLLDHVTAPNRSRIDGVIDGH
ncbi:YesL family protein [Streptococcus castoreus]|uniref:YesL family protein n=1 Tax=Streptococcus castoreus TaxID=254786 RepID=UPI000423A1FF|nr:DUF624 domain-containing protein [Streptococcus castoreus]